MYGGNELLEYRNFPDFAGKTVSVIGGREYCYGYCKRDKKERRERGYSNI